LPRGNKPSVTSWPTFPRPNPLKFEASFSLPRSSNLQAFPESARRIAGDDGKCAVSKIEIKKSEVCSMNKRNVFIGLGVVVLAVAWYAFRPELLFINKTINEDFPGGAQLASIEKEPMSITKGTFKSLAHETKGSAVIYQLAEGKRTLRLTEFETSNGPDVHVYLTAAEVEKGSDAIKAAGFIDLGSMKGNKGDQNYDIPAGVDLNKYKNVTIWCARFGVNFGEAPLVGQHTARAGAM
jgi:hypothetical protein